MSIDMSKPHGNCKLKICNRYTHTIREKSIHNSKVSHRITKKENKRGKEEKKTFLKKANIFFNGSKNLHPFTDHCLIMAKGIV